MKTLEQLKTLFEDAMQDTKNLYFTHSGHDAARDSYISGVYSLYKNMFGKYPYEFAICQFIEPVNSYERFTDDDFEFAAKYIEGYDSTKRVDYAATLHEIYEQNGGHCYVVSMGGTNMIILDGYIVVWAQEASFSVLCPMHTEFKVEEFEKCEKIHAINFMFCGHVWNDEFNINKYVKFKDGRKKITAPTYKFVIRDSSGFKPTNFPLKANININIKENYNDNLPYKEITEFIEDENRSGLVIFRGEPGTGKTYFIRHLISNFRKYSYIVLSEACLGFINDPTFLKLLMDNENSIVILEDCERVLKERNKNTNELISTLLNLTDGLLGDAIKVRFICSFNTKLENVDPALLRKGRLVLDYEFGKLSEEKTFALGKKLGKDIPEKTEMSLADIYNFEKKTNYRKEKRKIGFGV